MQDDCNKEVSDLRAQVMYVQGDLESKNNEITELASKISIQLQQIEGLKGVAIKAQEIKEV